MHFSRESLQHAVFVSTPTIIFYNILIIHQTMFAGKHPNMNPLSLTIFFREKSLWLTTHSLSFDRFIITE